MHIHPYVPRLGFGPRDIVRCIETAGLPDAPLTRGHIYTVKAVEGLDTIEPAKLAVSPIVHLEGIPGAFAPFRFKLQAHGIQPSETDPVAIRMARVMRRHEAETGACTADDLARAGFTSAQILEYADEARGLAGAPSELAAA
jgi:hypothetical protein